MPFPPSIRKKIIPKGPMQFVLEPQIHHFNGLFFQDSRKPMIFWGGLRYPFTHDTVDGTTSSHWTERCFLSIIYVDGDKNRKPHWFLKGKGWKTGKNLMIPIHNKNLASIATISKVGMLMINRVISQQHQNRNPTKNITRVSLRFHAPPKQWEPHWLQLSNLP